MCDEQTGALYLVAQIREALGGNGTRMQDELITYCRNLAAMPARIAELEAIITQQPATSREQEWTILALREALDDIRWITEEVHTVRPDTSRLSEIRACARYVLDSTEQAARDTEERVLEAAKAAPLKST
jgi:hypothetical protein